MEAGGGLGTVTADALVLAAGAATSEVAALINPELATAVPVLPVEGSMYSTAAPPPASGDDATPRLRTLVAGIESELAWASAPATVPPQLTHAHAGPTAAAVHSNTSRITRHFYGKSTADGRFLFGGDRWLTRDCSDATLLLDELDSVHRHARELLAPEAADPAISERWAASMPFTPDGKPLIGRIDHPSLRKSPYLKGAVSGLFVVTGLGASGFMKVSRPRMIHTWGLETARSRGWSMFSASLCQSFVQ